MFVVPVVVVVVGTVNDTQAASMGLVYTCAATGVCGFGYVVALLFCTRDIPAALEHYTGSAAVAVFLFSAGPQWGAVLAWLIVVNLWFSGVSSVAVRGVCSGCGSRHGKIHSSSRRSSSRAK